MEESSTSLPHSHSLGATYDNATAGVAIVADQPADSGGGSTNGAKYRLMSPAKLPISRSTCITIPPGLSPTSFLESPVLLSNIKAEPSPTTGSFFKLQLMQGTGQNTTLSAEKITTRRNNTDEKMSSSFEFSFHTGASSTTGLSSAGLSYLGGMNPNGPVILQDQRFTQSPAPSSLPSQSMPVNIADSSICSTPDDSNPGGHSNTGIPASSSDHKDSISSVSAERTSDDGYNWRKYGQKLVKGSEFPRSYYKCTYPNCEVKKIFERSPSGQITEIFYKGSHDHPKPQAPRRQNPGALMAIQEDKSDKDLSFTGQEDQNGSPVLSPLQANEDGADGSGSQILGVNDDNEEEDPFMKRRRKMEDGIDITPVVKPIREPRVVVQTVSEVDILDDGYRWRKYGQKVVRGNPNPRSYYKCTSVGCPVRKHVERASHDPKAVITTYEGKHNHDVPTARNSSHEFALAAAAYTGASKSRPQESGSVSLDLGVGIGRHSNNRATEPVQPFDSAGQVSQNHSTTSMMGIQAAQQPPCYGIVNGGLNLYGGGRSNHGEGSHNSFQAQQLHPSNQCPPNIGRVQTGL
ncbi:probable WRKY transcription factor 20 isoform X3 [Andrographis paniculata]|uniref:probable WRKY transcription factor 20 isoform X3 n=1 Tax=Andrographis paniculata TaxID=175694 RepID=UPI0021E953FC|nr:probable WRKY transcription factor 20 isoform X3 [Andrographis paniculata]